MVENNCKKRTNLITWCPWNKPAVWYYCSLRIPGVGCWVPVSIYPPGIIINSAPFLSDVNESCGHSHQKAGATGRVWSIGLLRSLGFSRRVLWTRVKWSDILERLLWQPGFLSAHTVFSCHLEDGARSGQISIQQNEGWASTPHAPGQAHTWQLCWQWYGVHHRRKTGEHPAA